VPLFIYCQIGAPMANPSEGTDPEVARSFAEKENPTGPGWSHKT
jgi:hypothetical protein